MGYYGKRKIKVERQNLADIQQIKSQTLDVITQNLGGHHLPKEQIAAMYQKFHELLKPKGILGIGDVMLQPIKVLAGIPDDVGAPEYPYDVRDLSPFVADEVAFDLQKRKGNCYPPLGQNQGFYTVQVYEKVYVESSTTSPSQVF